MRCKRLSSGIVHKNETSVFTRGWHGGDQGHNFGDAGHLLWISDLFDAVVS